MEAMRPPHVSHVCLASSHDTAGLWKNLQHLRLSLFTAWQPCSCASRAHVDPVKTCGSTQPSATFPCGHASHLSPEKPELHWIVHEVWLSTANRAFSGIVVLFKLHSSHTDPLENCSDPHKVEVQEAAKPARCMLKSEVNSILTTPVEASKVNFGRGPESLPPYAAMLPVPTRRRGFSHSQLSHSYTYTGS
eukprot:425723-Rhodomonas_salina.1